MSLSHKQASIYRLLKETTLQFFFSFSSPSHFSLNSSFLSLYHFFPLSLTHPPSAILRLAIGGKICLTTAISYLFASESFDECGGSSLYLFF